MFSRTGSKPIDAVQPLQPRQIQMPIGLQVKVATSHGKPAFVVVELLDGTNRPSFLSLTRAEARRLSSELLRASDRLPAGDVPAIEVGAT